MIDRYATPAEIEAFARDPGELQALEWRDRDDKLVARSLAAYCVMKKGVPGPYGPPLTVRIPANDVVALLDAAR